MPSQQAAPSTAYEYAGKLTDAQFDALLASRSITGEALIEALRDHLVGGLSPNEAWTKHAEPQATAGENSERPLAPGTVDAEHFDLLLEGTSIHKGTALVEALREHLVKGVTGPDAIVRNGVNKSAFYSRLKIIRDEHQRVSKLARFYR